MLVHLIQIILNFLYACQSLSWLISLLKLHKYRDISSPEWEIFLKFGGYISGMLVHYFQIILNSFYVYQSVSWLTSLLYYINIEPSPVLDEISLWNSLRHSRDIVGLFPNYSKLFVCPSVCSLAHFLTEIRLSLDISSSRWVIFCKFSGDILGIFVHWFQIILDFFYVIKFVNYLTSLLK